jgi:hypothetical protein
VDADSSEAAARPAEAVEEVDRHFLSLDMRRLNQTQGYTGVLGDRGMRVEREQVGRNSNRHTQVIITFIDGAQATKQREGKMERVRDSRVGRALLGAVATCIADDPTSEPLQREWDKPSTCMEGSLGSTRRSAHLTSIPPVSSPLPP